MIRKGKVLCVTSLSSHKRNVMFGGNGDSLLLLFFWVSFFHLAATRWLPVIKNWIFQPAIFCAAAGLFMLTLVDLSWI